MLHYARHAFSGPKSIKNFGPLLLDLATLNALAPALARKNYVSKYA